MNMYSTHRLLVAFLLSSCAVNVASAAGTGDVYQIDPAHTYPSFEADHMGISLWRGKFNATSGRMVLDKAAGSGSVDVSIDIGSVDFGLESMREHALGSDFFDVARYPQATYRGKLEAFKDGVPTRVSGELTLHGVTRPVELTINSFKCIPHPMLKRDLCGADASATFDREQFGLSAGKDYGFDMAVRLRIQFEALKAE